MKVGLLVKVGKEADFIWEQDPIVNLGPKYDEKRHWRKTYSDEIHRLYCSSNILTWLNLQDWSR